ncbi:MAG: hypothetical protein VXW65_08155 [Pseudomonadota bacterium]|nr:hypothetical protein [Pseudomonadota bacterium]
MNPALLSRIPAALVAFLMVLLLSSWFAPGGDSTRLQQIDFWLIWLVCMLLLALPLTLLETALARRSQTAPLQAIVQLTREADVRPAWRLVGWLAVGVMAIMAGGMAHQSARYFDMIEMTQAWSVPLWVWAVLMPMVAVGLSWIPRIGVWLGAIVALMAIELSTFAQGVGHWAWTDFSLAEWSSAVILALVASGLGMGLYWQSAVLQPTSERASLQALPIWGAQVIGGVLFALAQGVHGNLATLLYAIALLCGAGYLIAMVRVQLVARGLSVAAQWGLLAICLVVWILPWSLTWAKIASGMGLLVCLVYAVFSGWHMKISHLRKALNFSHEATYNLWRVAMRILIPLAVIAALVGLVGQVVQLWFFNH